MQKTFLHVKVLEARGLVAADRGGTSDPFVRMQSNLLPKEVSIKCRPCKKTLTPRFNLALAVPQVTRSDLQKGVYAGKEVVIDVFDWNLIAKNEFLGRVAVDPSVVLAEEKNIGHSYVQQWMALQPRDESENKKDKVSYHGKVTGEVLVLIILDDLNIPEEEMQKYQQRVRLASDKIAALWTEFKRSNSTKEIASVKELLELFKKTGVLEACVHKWNGSSAAIENPQFAALQEDPEVMELVFRNFFDAFDTDKSGSINFEELIVGLNFLLEGSREEVCRMHFKSRDKNGDGVLTREEARHLAHLTIALIKAGFMLGIRTQKQELIRAGLKEADFVPICDAITGAFEAHDVASIEVDLMFKYADKDKDGVVSEEEYVQWSMNDEEMAMRRAELQQRLMPCIRDVKIGVKVAMTQLLARVAQ